MLTLSGEVSYIYSPQPIGEENARSYSTSRVSVVIYRPIKSTYNKKKDIHLTRESDNTLCIGQQGLGSLEEEVLKTLHEGRHLSDP